MLTQSVLRISFCWLWVHGCIGDKFKFYKAVFFLGPGLTPSETIGLLSQTGLYDMAFSIATKFNLPLKNIFESIAGK